MKTLSKSALLAIAQAKLAGATAVISFVNELPDDSNIVSHLASEATPKRKYTKRAGSTKKAHGRKYTTGTHWTQTPWGKRKLAKMGRASKAAAIERRAKAK